MQINEIERTLPEWAVDYRMREDVVKRTKPGDGVLASPVMVV